MELGGGMIMEARKLTLYFFLSYCKHSSSHHCYHHHHNHSNHHHRRRKEKSRGNAHSRGPIQSSYSSKKQSPKSSQKVEAEAEDDDEEEEEGEKEDHYDHYHDHDQPESPSQYINSPIDYSNSTHFLKQAEAEAEEEAGEDSGEKPKRMIHPSSLIGCFCLRRLRRVSHSSSADHSVLKRGNAQGRATIFERAEPSASVCSSDANALASPGRPRRDTAIARRLRGTSSSSSSSRSSGTGGSGVVVGLAAGGRRSPASRSGRAAKWKPGLEIIREDRLAVVVNQAIVPVPVGLDQERSRIKKTLAKPSQQQYYSWYSYHRKSISAKASYNKINWLHDGRSPLHSNNPLSFMF